ncbi:MAG: outer-membrane lipoprotein carrier protein LolA [bacterium]|nr:outer-membrane lipoprotein carrier protein LolA [bacterium]
MSLRFNVTAAFAAAVLVMPLAGRDALDAFQAKYTKLKSVSCTFRDATGMRGSLKARKGGMYHITLSDREIICDGQTVWNVVPSTKTVVLNTYKPSSDEVSLERVFFLMLNIYRPTLISHTKQSSLIRLAAPREDAMLANINQAEIILDRRNIITSINVTEYGTTSTWFVSKLVLDRKLPPSTFTFSIPKGWQTVDLR